jgi:biopolymer transport protein ExbD
MGIGQFSSSRSNQGDNRHMLPMSDINVTPMVDVMLVLLVIFIITAPLLTHAIKLDLPKTQAAEAPAQAQAITLSFDAQGRLYWDQDALPLSQLEARLQQAASRQPQPELQLRADKGTRYEIIAQVMAAAQAQGLTRIGFVTEPLAVPPARK